MLRLLSGDRTYRETHNAMLDAVNELEIMRLPNHNWEIKARRAILATNWWIYLKYEDEPLKIYPRLISIIIACEPEIQH